MAKDLKISLNIDGVKIRSLADLQEHFVLDEVLACFQRGALQNWLKSRGFENQYQAVIALEGQSLDIVIQNLPMILGVTFDDSELKAYVSEVKFQANVKAATNASQADDPQVEKQRTVLLIGGYYERYVELVDKIIDNPKSLETIKASVKELIETYHHFLDLDFTVFINRIVQKAPLAMLVLMCYKEWWDMCDLFDNHQARWCKYLSLLKDIPQTSAPSNQNQSNAVVDVSTDNSVMGWLTNIGLNVASYLNSNVPAQVTGVVSEYDMNKLAVQQLISKCQPAWRRYIQSFDVKPSRIWEGCVPSGKTCLVVNFTSDFEIRSAGTASKMAGVMVREPFALLDGLEYRSSVYSSVSCFVLD